MSPTKDEQSGKLSDMHWKDRYEYEARLEDEALGKLSEAQLLERIQKRRLGSYFSIWRVIAKKGSLENASMVLWDFLQATPGERDMLHRYHCAAALFKILGMDDPASKNELRIAVQWDHNGEDARQQALLDLKDLIAEELGSAA